LSKSVEAKLIEIAQALRDMSAAGAPPMDVLGFIVNSVERLQPGSVAGVTFLDPARSRFVGGFFPTLEPAFAKGLSGASTAPPFVGSCAMSVGQGETVTCLDVKNDSRFTKPWRDHCLAHGLASLESCPVLDGRTTIGTFVLGFSSPGGTMVIDGRVIRFAAAACAEPLVALRPAAAA